MPSGEEIQKSLRTFVKNWSGYSGSEKGEAQTFLNELFAAYGTDRRQVGAEFEFFAPEAGFMDLHWPEVCLIEMKAPSVAVRSAHDQVRRYWTASSDMASGQRAARWVVICNFAEIEIWQPGDFPREPVVSFPLAELPDRYDALAFLTGPNVEPSFVEHHRELTKDAAGVVAEVFHALVDRGAASPREIHRFVLQSIWCMFAEDLGMLADYPFDTTLRAVRDEPERSLPELTMLFSMLNKRRSPNRTGRLAGTTYVNGDLFAQPAEVALQREEIDLLVRAGEFDWRQVDPTIFGSLLEGVLGHDQRWRRGAHYTHEVDILKIVTPRGRRPSASSATRRSWATDTFEAPWVTPTRIGWGDSSGWASRTCACTGSVALSITWRSVSELDWWGPTPSHRTEPGLHPGSTWSTTKVSSPMRSRPRSGQETRRCMSASSTGSQESLSGSPRP